MSGEGPASEWWRVGSRYPRCRAHLAEVLADLYPRGLSQLRRDRRLHEGEAYEIASRIVQRLIDEYERGKTYRVHPHIVVNSYCAYLTKEYLAEKQYTRCDSLDATRTDPYSGEATPLVAEPIDPMRPIEDQVADVHFVQKVLAHEAMTPNDVEVLEMRYLQGMDIDDIANLLRIERNAVDQRIHRALRRVRDLTLSA